MSFRREPRTIPEKIAAMEEQLRRAQRAIVLQPATGLSAGILLAKGDLIVATAAGVAAHLPVGADGEVLVADSSSPVGLSYAAPGGDMLAYLMDEA